ncbi:Rhomboid family [Rhizoctonia solani]|uniref:Rhomboid family n=1 Tax=Rhizoctonia solani TaxID=456999 RepID=A0A8H7HAT0_9AGAM|nr:Rhomboid family [Rhizoctonia solani]
MLKNTGMPRLPPPTTASTPHEKNRDLYGLAKSKRGVALLLVLSITSLFCVFDAAPLIQSRMISYGHSQPHSWPQLGSLDVSGTNATTPLTSLGLEADKSFHLGSTVKETYKAELKQFIQRAFPKGLREMAHASIELYLGDHTQALPEIPHNIYQTSKKDPNLDWRSSTWRNIPDYRYWFFNDESADKWVRSVFGGSEMEKVWDALGSGVKRADMLRYLLVAVEGGIYSDVDTVRLKGLDKWGHGANFQGPKSKGSPSVFVGIEADVGTRSDWHKWWPRPLQIVQWTFAAAPFHPILIDTLRRVYHVTAIVEANKGKNQTSNATDLEGHWVGGELLRDDGTISIMEWTGPGVFTDSVIRYLAAEHNTTWPMLKNLRRPLRIRDMVVLPVTGFSPGVGLFGAGDTANAEAMVQHLFAGSWKSVKRPASLLSCLSKRHCANLCAIPIESRLKVDDIGSLFLPAAMSKPYDPPEYVYTPNSPSTQPVNFNDEPSGSNLYHVSKHSLGASTELSYPQSKFNSGVSIEQDDPFVSGDGYKGGLNERGETRAQALASEYRSSPVNLSPRARDGALSSSSSQTFSSSEQSKDLLAKRKSVASSNLDAMTYVDENYNIYRSPQMKNGDQFNDNASLVDHAAAPAGTSRRMADLEYAEAVTPSPDHPDNAKKSVMARLLGNDGARNPIEQRIQAKRAGAGRQRYPFVVWLLSLAMLGVMIWELVRNNQEQGSPISLKPYINPMLGPSSSGLVNLGGRFVPCMKLVSEIPPSFNLGCFNNTANPATELCSVETLCGFGEFKGGDPNQWFRFITPIFLHAGIIHFALNMFAQLTLSAQVEREMGSGAFLILYASAGIFGNVLGGNFALVGVPSVGASGAIFGTVAVMWVDLLAHWKIEYRPGRKLAMLCVDLIIGVALGFVPGVDNFAHLGGFLMGLLTAIVLYPVISTTKRHKAIMWICRLAMIPVAVVLFVVLIRNFYTSDPYAACQWCRYLSCIPASWNNRCQGTVNTHGTPRLAKFYTPTPANTRAVLPRRIFELVSSRPAGLCNFLDAPGLLTDTGASRTGDLSSVGGGGWEWEGEEKELQRARVVYRLYATLYFVFVVDGAESELGVLDLIQVFVESLDRAFENVCELDLVFHFDEVHHILAELVQGGLVLETNVDEIARAGMVREKERLTVHGTWCAAPLGLGPSLLRHGTIKLELGCGTDGWMDGLDMLAGAVPPAVGRGSTDTAVDRINCETPGRASVFTLLRGAMLDAAARKIRFELRGWLRICTWTIVWRLMTGRCFLLSQAKGVDWRTRMDEWGSRFITHMNEMLTIVGVYAVQERQKVQKASYAADNPLAAIGSGAVGGPRGGGLRGLQTPLGWIANRAFPTVGTRFAIPPDPAQKTNELDWLLYSGANANTGIDALLAPHPDAFERELDDLGIDDSLLSSLVVPNDDIANLNAFLAHRSPVCGPGSAITVSSDSLSYYNEFSNHGLESLYNESLSAYGGAVSEHSLFAHSDLDINLDALNTFHMPSPQRQSRSPSGEISDNSSAYGHSRSSSNSLFDVPTGYENISANGYYIQPSSNYARRNHSGLVHRDVPSQHLQARAQAHPYVPADHAYDHAGSGNESPEQSDPRRKYQCPQCPRAFARQFNLKTHMATHDPNRTKPHVCHHAGCGRSFSRKHDLGRHLVSIHQDAEHNNNTAATSPKRAASSVAVKSEREWCDRCGRGWVKSERARDACQCDDSS